MRKQKVCNGAAQQTQGAGHEERVLTGSRLVGCIILDNGEHIRPNKRPDLAHGSRDAVVLTSDRCCASFARNQPDVVAGPNFAKGGEHTGGKARSQFLGE